ncbi:uncharacterized protein LOC117175452 [Belonocnema kinseyi]|uniref:uncharacterized protein LOC117175452 n=1 Tax=Belonocnema kinseyi TaxID=2817044 RepID=UPI00143DA43E|nr:uncharacterized protein LOC117175452 [Belonocnema kinseyi]
MNQFFLLTIFIYVALGVVLEDSSIFKEDSSIFKEESNIFKEDPSILNFDALNGNDSTSLDRPDSTYQIDERFAGSSGLFFLHLLKHKLNKLQYLEKIATTPGTLPNCICVPYYQCDRNNNIILDGFGNIDIRLRPCTGNQEVCCYLRIVTTMASMQSMSMRPTMMMTMPMMTMPPMTMPPMTMPPMTMPPMTMPPMTIDYASDDNASYDYASDDNVSNDYASYDYASDDNVSNDYASYD